MITLHTRGVRRCLAIGLGLALGACGPAGWAQSYPDRAIKLIVPFAPGGSTDLAARLVAEFTSREIGQPMVVENRAGAGGAIGAEAIARATPDGYTVGMATVSTHGANPALFKGKIKYDAVKDFTPVTNVATVPSVLAIHAGVPANSLAEFVALAKAEPGKYTFASPGVGSLGHANIEHLQHLAGMTLLHVPYKGSGAALNDALAGQVHAITDNLPSALPHIQAGRLKALAVLSSQRSPVLPDVPTYGELGYGAMGEGGWFGVVAPAGTPDAVVTRLRDAIHAAMRQPAFIQRMDEVGATLIPGDSADFARQIQEALARYETVARVANIQVQ